MQDPLCYSRPVIRAVETTAVRSKMSVGDLRGWISSPRYDLGLLILPLLLGTAMCGVAAAAPEYQTALVFGTFFLLGMPHYVSSYAFYLDDANRAYYRTRKAAFYLGPVVVVGLLTASFALRLHDLVAVVVVLWNVYHVARQNHGILSIYRQLGGGNHLRERRAANFALLGLNGGVYALVMHRQPSIARLLGWLPPKVPLAIAVVILGVGLLALGILLGRMAARPVKPALPEGVFLGASILFFAPFLLVEDPTLAVAAMLSGHYIQYLGLVWLLNRRKYGDLVGSWGQRSLGWVSQNLYGLASVFLLISGGAALFHWTAVERGAPALSMWAFNAVVLLHFYVDGLCWSLRQPAIRQSTAPFLILPEHRRIAAV
jgi:hypothetical protein